MFQELNKPEAESKKPFGLWSATLLVVANMIGAGVFTTSGFSLADLGERQFVLLAWFIGALVAICGAVSYGQLAQRITESGGEYLFLSRFVHPSIGFVAGWVSLLAGFTGAIAFAATAFESYAIPESVRPDWFRPGIASIATIMIFAALHAVVLRIGILAQNLVVVLKLLLLVGFTGFAFWKFPAGWEGMQLTTQPTTFSVFALASTLVWISLSFSGFNAAVYITGEVEKPKTNVPRAMIIGTVIVACLYMLLNLVFVYGPAPEKITGVPDIAAAASQTIGGSQLATLIRIIVSIALLSSVSSMLIAGPRVYAKMADDGLFPRILTSTKRGLYDVPAAAIWLQAIFASIVVYFSSLKSLLDYLGFTLSVSAAISIACIFWTKRERDSSLQRVTFSTIAAIYVGATLILATLSAINRPQQLIGFAITLASGLLLYCVFDRIRRVN